MDIEGQSSVRSLSSRQFPPPAPRRLFSAFASFLSSPSTTSQHQQSLQPYHGHMLADCIAPEAIGGQISGVHSNLPMHVRNACTKSSGILSASPFIEIIIFIVDPPTNIIQISQNERKCRSAITAQKAACPL